MSCLHCTIKDDVTASIKEQGFETTAAYLVQVAAEVVAGMPANERLEVVARLIDHFQMCFLDAVGGALHPSRVPGVTH